MLGALASGTRATSLGSIFMMLSAWRAAVSVDEPGVVMPMRLPFKPSAEVMLESTMTEKTSRLVTAAIERRSAPLRSASMMV
jgi:hypothetical protein